MARINNPPPKAPLWPWGGPRSVRERLVDPAQFERTKRARRAGDPKNPALASTALLDFIGHAHSSEEMRLPGPVHPEGHDADLEGYLDRPHLASVAERAESQGRQQLDKALANLKAPPERVERLKALLQREAQMLTLVGQIHEDMREILRRMYQEQKDEGF